MKHAQLNIKYSGFGIHEAECPICRSTIRFTELSEDYGISVNCESKGEVHVPKMLHLMRRCKNPLCEWSTIKERE